MTAPIAVGIDFGTTNSVVAAVDRDGAPRILTTESGSTTMPSVVWYSPAGPVVGEAALEGFDHSPEATIVGVKRLLGRRFNDPEIRKLAHVLPYELIESPNGDTWIRLSAGRTTCPEEVAALILRELRRTAERFFGTPVTQAVLSIPAWYNAVQRQATKDAAQIAGLTVLRFVSEPTAAVLGTGVQQTENRRYVVCDLGGGTFDVAAVDVEAGVCEVIATAVDTFWGGDDIDRMIVEQVLSEVLTEQRIDMSLDSIGIERIRIAAQQAKHELSAKDEVALTAQLGEGFEHVRLIRRDEVEQWASPLVKRVAAPLVDVLRRCGRDRSDVDTVVLVGGGAWIPMVRRELARILDRSPTDVRNPQEVVAVGAALEVARLAGAIQGVLRMDVAARGVAMSTQGSDCEFVVAQNAVLPTREHRLIATRQDDQRRLEFDLWEGESRDPARNRHLGRYAAVDLPRAPAGEVLVVVEVTLDADGVVRVGASELVSGQRVALEPLFQAGLSRAEVSQLADQWSESAA